MKEADDSAELLLRNATQRIAELTEDNKKLVKENAILRKRETVFKLPYLHMSYEVTMN